MRYILFLLLFPSVLFAQERMVSPADVLSVITADWNHDGHMDRAVLIENREMGGADLIIYIGTKDGMVEDTYAAQIAWQGGMWGQQPSLSLSDSGSLLLHSLNSSIGRDRWENTLTIAYRNEVFVVAGFTYSYYDTLDHDNNGYCDLNLLTGRGVVALNGDAEQEIDGIAFGGYVSEWHMENFPGECM